jgi:hypothetical protein
VFFFYLIDEEDRFGSGPSVEVVGDELDLAFAGGDSQSGVGISSSWDHLFGSLANIGWASDEELDVLVFVGSICPPTYNCIVSSSTSNISDAIKFVNCGGD